MASRRAISVLPTPVGPISMMFLGVTCCAQIVGELPAPPAVAQGDRHGPLGIGLADDVAVQLGHGLPGRQLTFALGLMVWHGSSSTVRFTFV